MESKRPSQLKDHHLRKLAFAYSRVSTKEQVERSRGSLATQEDQSRFALEDGFPLERIRFVDNDLGVSGKSMANRVGIGEVRDAVRAAQAGAIYVSHDRSYRSQRLREPRSRQGLHPSRRRHRRERDALQPEGSPPADSTAVQILLGRNRKHQSPNPHPGRYRGLYQAGGGIHYPAGRLRAKRGRKSWVKDPDPRVREPIEAVFRILPRRKDMSQDGS